MPRNIDQGFEVFLKKLIPSEFESVSARDHRASISACLDNNFGLRRFVRIGSFGNGTSISGHSDVDYLASLNRDALTRSSSYSLTKIRDVLNVRFPNTGVRVSCPAVVVPFGIKKSETTEIVPADYIEEKHGFKVYDIADGNDGWMRACPDAHNAYVTSIDKKLNGKLKPLVRFIKAWKYFQNVPIGSFYLELRVAKYAESEESIVYGIDITRIFDMLTGNSLAAIQDPIGISGYISACKSSASRLDALSKLNTAATRADKAWEAQRAGRVSEAFDYYRLLYNYEFPTYYF